MKTNREKLPMYFRKWWTGVYAVCALRIKGVTSISSKNEMYLYLTKAVEWKWTDRALLLFSLNLLILVSPEIVSLLLGLVCWRFIDCYLQLFYLAVRRLWMRKMKESRNRFRDSKKFASIYLWWWIKLPRGGTLGLESSQLWVAAWLRTLEREMSSEREWWFSCR